MITVIKQFNLNSVLTVLLPVVAVNRSNYFNKMSKPKVLIVHSNIPEPGLDLLKESCELIICPELPYPSSQEIAARATGVSAIMWFSKQRCDKTILDAAGPSLKIVSAMSAGVDNLDLPEIKSRGILISNTPRVLDGAVSEVAVLLALAAARRLHEGRNKINDNKWEFGPQWMLGQDLTGSTVGIVGLGGIGQSIAKRLKGFEIARIVYSGHRRKPEGDALGAEFVTFDNLLQQSDFVIVACPLTPETKDMFNETAFSKMKKTSVFVNVSRGGVVVQEALKKALKNKTIFAAGLDVMTPEPLPSDDELLTLPNCVIIPHLGSATIKTRSAMAQLSAKNILAALEGKPLLTPV